MFKVDLSRAFRCFPADPLSYPLLGLQWKGQIYVDTCVPFGVRTGCMICQRVTNSISHVMKRDHGCVLVNYIDDCVSANSCL